MLKVLLYLIFIPFFLTLSPEEDDCKKLLKECSRKVSMRELPAGKQVYYMHYEMTNQAKPGSNAGNSRTEMKVTLGRSQMNYESNYVSMYRDSMEVYTVIHPQKLIVRSSATKDGDATFRQQSLSKMQDTLIDKGTMKPCRTATYYGKNVKVAELVLHSVASDKSGIERIVYYLNEQKQTIEGQEIFYNQNASLLKSDVRFHMVDFNYKEKFRAKARDYIYEGGKLRSSWKGYKVEDNL